MNLLAAIMVAIYAIGKGTTYPYTSQLLTMEQPGSGHPPVQWQRWNTIVTPIQWKFWTQELETYHDKELVGGSSEVYRTASRSASAMTPST